MEIILTLAAVIIFIRSHIREEREARLRAQGPLQIELDAVIERDDAGNISVIRINLS